MKIHIQLNQMMKVYSGQSDYLAHILQLISMCRAAGADTLSLSLDSEMNQLFTSDELKLIRLNAGSFFTLRIPLEEDYIKQSIILKPDMIIFYEKLDKNTAEPLPLQGVGQESLENALLSLEANNIPTGLLIPAELEILKEINKTTLDWIELDVLSYTTAEDTNDQLAEMQKMTSFTSMAQKMGFGLTAIGRINQSHLFHLKKVSEIEEICFGWEFWNLAMKNGIQKALELILVKLAV